MYVTTNSQSSTAPEADAATVNSDLPKYDKATATRVPITAEIRLPVETKIAGIVITDSTEYGT